MPDATAAAVLALALMLVEELALLELDVKDGAAWAAAPASCEKRHDAPHRQPAELPKNRHRLGAAAKSRALDGPVSFADPESAKRRSSRRGWVERRETRLHVCVNCVKSKTTSRFKGLSARLHITIRVVACMLHTRTHLQVALAACLADAGTWCVDQCSITWSSCTCNVCALV